MVLMAKKEKKMCQILDLAPFLVNIRMTFMPKLCFREVITV